MPHSSGGGSHGGGSHGGHHSSSGGSGSNRSRSNTYFNGAKRYVYYKNKKPVYYYSDIEITPEYIKKRKKQWNLANFGLIAFYSIFYISMFFSAVYVVPHKLSSECTDPNVIIDTTDIISDSEEKQMMAQLDEFRNTTGISVTILTVNDEEWFDNYYTLENYAYDYYLATLSDEKNWLIVYSEPESYTDFNDWKWEGMQGDDTDPILTEPSTKKFTNEMHKNISKYGFANAVTVTFDYYNDIVMKPTFDIVTLIIATLVICLHGGIFFLVFWLVFGSQIKIDEKSIKLADPQATYIEDKCSYCDGLFLHGIHTSCPHCGAALNLYNPLFDEEEPI